MVLYQSFRSWARSLSDYFSEIEEGLSATLEGIDGLYSRGVFYEEFQTPNSWLYFRDLPKKDKKD